VTPITFCPHLSAVAFGWRLFHWREQMTAEERGMALTDEIVRFANECGKEHAIDMLVGLLLAFTDGEELDEDGERFIEVHLQ